MAHSPGFLDDEQIDAAGAAGPSLPSPVMGYQSNLERIDLGRDFAVGIVPRPRNYSGSAGDPEGLWKLASRKLAGLVPCGSSEVIIPIHRAFLGTDRRDCSSLDRNTQSCLQKIWMMRARGSRDSQYDGHNSAKLFHQHKVGF